VRYFNRVAALNFAVMVRQVYSYPNQRGLPRIAADLYVKQVLRASADQGLCRVLCLSLPGFQLRPPRFLSGCDLPAG